MTVERWWPNGDAALDPVEIFYDDVVPQHVVIQRADLVRVFEAAGYISDIVLTPHPHKMVCPVCGLTRYLPDGWQVMLGSDTLTCTLDQVALVAS